MLAVLALAWLVLGIGVGQLPWLPAPWFWAAFYFVGAICTGWCALALEDPLAIAYAGASSVVANVMRGLVIIYSKVTEQPGTTLWSVSQIVVGVTTAWALAFLVGVLFLRRVSPLASVERARR